MTPEQIATLRTFALADQTAAGYIAAGSDKLLAEWFNADTAFVVYRTNVPRIEIQNESGTAQSPATLTFEGEIGTDVAFKIRTLV